MLDTFPTRSSTPPPPESGQLPRPECAQCGGRIGLSHAKSETKARGSQWFHFITQHCAHCDVDFVAIFRRDGGAWSFIKTRMITAAERMQRPGRKRRKAG